MPNVPNLETGKRNTTVRRHSRGHKRLPLFGIVLGVCYVVIPGLLFFIGMRDVTGLPDDNNLPPPPGGSAVISNPEDETPAPVEETPVPMPPPVKVNGIYYDVHFPQNNALERNLEFIETTTLNAIVIDVKDDYGYITFATENETYAAAIAAFAEGFHREFITKEKVEDMKARGIYTIARIVCFKDDFYIESNPSHALQDREGGVWRDAAGNAWLNPYNTDGWEHIANVCKEAAMLGFEEIQLDYVRFPSDGQLSRINYGQDVQELNKYQIINEFVTYIRDKMHMLGVRVSADILGIVGMSYLDASAVGQNMQLLLGSLDSICPMIYPSHFANSSNSTMGNGVGQFINGVLFERPDLEPHGVVYNTLYHYMSQIETFREENPDASVAIIRPYLQYFTATYLPEGYWQTYDTQQVKEQIQAVIDAGFEEWILWRTSNSNINVEAFTETG